MANQGLGNGHPRNGRILDSRQNQELAQNQHVIIGVINQQCPASEPRPEMTTPIQENQNHLGQAVFGYQSVIQTDGDRTIHDPIHAAHPGEVSSKCSSAIQCSDTGQSETPYEVACGVQREKPMISNGASFCPPAQKSPTIGPMGQNCDVQKPSSAMHNDDQIFKDVKERKASFMPSPPIFHTAKQLCPGLLAENGFFYIGPDDTVKCYFCKATIWKWQKEDDILIEHIKHGPNSFCPYLVERYGMEFVKTIKDQMKTGVRRNATEPFICPDCEANTVDHLQLHCGHGICGKCIQCMKPTPMTSRICSSCNQLVIKYIPWCPGLGYNN